MAPTRTGKWLSGHKLLMLNVLVGVAIMFTSTINIPPAITRHFQSSSGDNLEEDILPAQRVLSITHLIFLTTALFQTLYSLVVLRASRKVLSEPEFNEKLYVLFGLTWLGLDIFGVYEFIKWRMNFADKCQSSTISGSRLNGCINQDSSIGMLICSMISLIVSLNLALHFYQANIRLDELDVEAGSSSKGKKSKLHSINTSNSDENSQQPFEINGEWFKVQVVKVESEQASSNSSPTVPQTQLSPPPYLQRPAVAASATTQVASPSIITSLA